MAADAGTAASAAPAKLWTVDPAGFEPNLPPAGRSLFDFLTLRKYGETAEYDIPYPFAALLRKIERQLKTEDSGASGLKRVLIPLGRSLQRAAAQPDFFKYPRVVVAAVGESVDDPGHAGLLLKDRLYLGFQERSNTIEVISYNEAAGRFEFQVVNNYAAGEKPQVSYANRAMCTACHQNSAPIFARQLWDETNANPDIASRLVAERRDFYGYPPQHGVDIPYAIDNATDRANLFAASQLLWREGCAAPESNAATRCRAELLRAVVQFRLSAGQGFEDHSPAFRDRVVAAFDRNARNKWPGGLMLANPDIVNRSVSPSNGANVAALFDPLTPRSALETWPANEPATLARRAVAGLAEFLSEQDVRRLDTQLVRVAPHYRRSTYSAACEFRRKAVHTRRQRLDFDCPSVEQSEPRASIRGRVYIEAGKINGGSVDQLTLVDDKVKRVMTDLLVQSSNDPVLNRPTIVLRVARAGRSARTADGNSLDNIRFTWPPTVSAMAARQPYDQSFTGRVTVTTFNDFEAVNQALDDLANEPVEATTGVFSGRPFRRASIMSALYARLGMQELNWCCENDTGMGPLEVAVNRQAANTNSERGSVLTPFYRYCATCHQSADRLPPNFLEGTPAQVAANIQHCAPRLEVRLAMWSASPDQRIKTPMPPIYALYRAHTTPESWRDSSDLAALRTYVQNILQKESRGLANDVSTLPGGYESLRPCLPPPEQGLTP